MSDMNPPVGDDGTARTAVDEAGRVAENAAESARRVSESAKDAVSDVAHETTTQARDLMHETRAQLIEQAGAQQQRVADGLRSLSDEFGSMARASEQPGIAADLVSTAASKTDAVASWLDGRDPGSLLTEVKEFARRKPGTFIAIAALAGVVAGRLTRSLASEAHDEQDSAASGSQGAGTPSAEPRPVVNTPPAEPTTITTPAFEGAADEPGMTRP